MAPNKDELVEIHNVKKYFGNSRSIGDVVFRRDPTPVRAVDDVSLAIEAGDVFGIAGESGCGKTTLGKLLVKLYQPTDGEIRFDGADITDLTRSEEAEFRRRVQMIFQDPFESLNPRMSVLDCVAEPLRINDMYDDYWGRRERVIEVLNDVGLAPAENYVDSFPNELSGGERQRVAIARALVVDPDFIVCDEPVSMLDVSIRAGVLNLMRELREKYGLTYVFISHDLSLIRYMCNKTAIMYLGDIVEVGATDEMIEEPKHPYTEALFNAVPAIDPDGKRERANVTGEVPDPRNPPSGCKFHTRCPKIIPPTEWEGSQDAFRRVHQFKRDVRDGAINVEELAPDDDDPDVTAREVLEQGLALEIPEEHQVEGAGQGTTERRVPLDHIDIPADAAAELRAAAQAVADGDEEEAKSALEGTFETICEKERPRKRPADGQVTACHLYADRQNSEELAFSPIVD